MPANSDITFKKIRAQRTRENVREGCTYGNKTSLKAGRSIETITSSCAVTRPAFVEMQIRAILWRCQSPPVDRRCFGWFLTSDFLVFDSSFEHGELCLPRLPGVTKPLSSLVPPWASLPTNSSFLRQNRKRVGERGSNDGLVTHGAARSSCRFTKVQSLVGP